MVFFHKYFLFKKFFPDIYTKYSTCAACLFISYKVCNQLVIFEDFVKIFLKLFFREQKIKEILTEKIIFESSQKLFEQEFDILNIIGFDLNVDLPYCYIKEKQMFFYITEFLKNKKLIEATTSFINDSFILPLCLYYDPLLIFLACIHLLEVYFNINLPNLNGIKWYHIIDNTVNYKDITEITMKIKIYYDFSNFCIGENKNFKDQEFKNIEKDLNFHNNTNNIKEFKDIIDFNIIFFNEINNSENSENINSQANEKLDSRNDIIFPISGEETKLNIYQSNPSEKKFLLHIVTNFTRDQAVDCICNINSNQQNNNKIISENFFEKFKIFNSSSENFSANKIKENEMLFDLHSSKLPEWTKNKIELLENNA